MSNSRGLVDLLVGDVGVKFPVEVVVFAVHLGSEVADAGINIRVYIAKALIHVGAKIVYTLVKTVYPLVKIANSIVHIAESRVHMGVKIDYPFVKIVYTLVKIADSIVHIAEALIHMGVKIDYPLVKIADSIVHIAESLVKIDESIVHITESLALYGYHVIKNSRESQNKTNKERYEFNVGHGGYSFRGYSGNCMTFARLMSRGKSRRRGRSGGDSGGRCFYPVGASHFHSLALVARSLDRTYRGPDIYWWALFYPVRLETAPTGAVTLLVGAVSNRAVSTHTTATIPS